MTFDVTKKYLNISDHDKYKDNGIYDVEKIIDACHSIQYQIPHHHIHHLKIQT